MSTAVRYETLNDDLTVDQTVDFVENEVMDIEIIPPQRANIEKSQSGKPTLFILANWPWHKILVKILIYGTSTEAKLATLRNHLLNDKYVRLYPKYYQDESIWFDGIIRPENIAILFAYSGRSMAGAIVNLLLEEITKEARVTGVFDEYYG